MTTTILALDPGGTTGWALARWGDEGDLKWHCGHIGPEEHHKELYDFLGMQQTDNYTIVTERFEYRNTSRPGLVLMSREYIGIVKLFHKERGGSLRFQNASQAKGFVKDRHIKELGLWSPGFQHAMDAYRHLLYYIIMSRKPGTEMLCDMILKTAYK